MGSLLERRGGMSVLIVDDNRALRKLARLILSETGAFGIIEEAADGADAVRKAGALRPDVVLLDLLMPVMDGFEALPLIRQASPASKLLVLSMVSEEGLADRVRRLGADGFIDKGNDEEQMTARILELVGTPLRAASK